MTDPANAFRRLSAAEALRALYIDFEGEKDKPPILLGVLRRPGRGPHSRFDRDHADAIYSLVGHDACIRFLVPASIKSAIRQALRDDHGIWRGSLFPDSAGAAETARAVFEGLAK